MTAFANLDLFSVGIAVAATLVLGFSVYFQNRQSVTGRTFLLFVLATSVWGIVNYAHYNATTAVAALWLIRLIMFCAVWQAFSLHQLFLVMPQEHFNFSKKYRLALFPLVIITALLTLTPLVFSRIVNFVSGEVPDAIPGPGIVLFGIVAIGLVSRGLYTLLKKFLSARGEERHQFRFVLFGALLMFVLIITFNFVLAAFLNDFRFLPLGAVFVLPFAVATFYSVFKHHLFHVRVFATEFLTFILAVATLYEVVVERNPILIGLRSGVFLLVLAVGILLIKSVLKEIEQRERIAEQAKELENLSRFKTQLLSLASHQIKAPLAVIKGFAELIEQGLYGPVSEKVKETVGKMHHSTDELIDLINDLLNFRQVEEGKLEYHFEKTDLRELVRNVCEKLKLLADEKHLEFSVHLPAEPAYANADKEKLSQVIQNVVDNSIKYTPRGRVAVNVECDRENVTIWVADTGLGITKDLLPHLFDEFIRDERVKKEVRGTGLGLYIARKIIEAHGGTIWAESEGEGRGSKFFVRIKKV